MRKNKIPEGFNRHHILCSSRGGSDDDFNIAIVDKKKHDLLHQLFSNMTPDEIINHLVTYFWNDQWEWVKIALNEMEELVDE